MVTKALDTSTEFLRQIVETIPDGERIKMCLQCGACSGACPFGFVMVYPPHGMIAAMRAGLIDDVLACDTAWMCVSCYACTQVCPAKIPVTLGLPTRVKEEMLLAGNVPTELQDALEKAGRYFNPLGESPRKRAEWAEGLDPEVPILAKTKEPVDVLWFVGDYASYHPSVRAATRAFARILQEMGVDFGILGPEEVCDGDSLRLAGEIGLFEMLAEKNGAAFEKYEFNEIITTDPHAYNALKNEYPRLGISYPVRHYTELLVEHGERLKGLIKKELEATVTYHDPCYLGRANGIYDAPRQVLNMIPGIELVEMTHRLENSLCCGGGGGGMWLDGFRWERAKSRISEWRMREAVSAMRNGASNGRETPPPQERILALACPYEPSRFADAAKSVPGAEGIEVKEIAELLAVAMGLEE
jgi:Fe-S oxidoreductase